MSSEKLSLLKEIVDYNKRVISENNGIFNKAIDETIVLDYKEYSIWNPFRDETMRFEVEPVKKYGEEKIDKFIDDYKAKKQGEE